MRELRKLDEEAELRIKQSQAREVPLPTTTRSKSNASVGNIGASSTSFRQEGYDPKKRKTTEGAGSEKTQLKKCWDLSSREDLQAKIARIFYIDGLPFHFARNPHYVKSYSKCKFEGFVPPGYNIVRGGKGQC